MDETSEAHHHQHDLSRLRHRGLRLHRVGEEKSVQRRCIQDPRPGTDGREWACDRDTAVHTVHRPEGIRGVVVPESDLERPREVAGTHRDTLERHEGGNSVIRIDRLVQGEVRLRHDETTGNTRNRCCFDRHADCRRNHGFPLIGAAVPRDRRTKVVPLELRESRRPGAGEREVAVTGDDRKGFDGIRPFGENPQGVQERIIGMTRVGEVHCTTTHTAGSEDTAPAVERPVEVIGEVLPLSDELERIDSIVES